MLKAFIDASYVLINSDHNPVLCSGMSSYVSPKLCSYLSQLLVHCFQHSYLCLARLLSISLPVLDSNPYRPYTSTWITSLGSVVLPCLPQGAILTHSDFYSCHTFTKVYHPLIPFIVYLFE